MFDKMKDAILTVFLEEPDYKSMSSAHAISTTQQEYKNISPVAQQYIYPMTREKREYVSKFLKQLQDEKGIVVTNPEETTIKLRFYVKQLTKRGVSVSTRFLDLTWQDLENLILYHIEDGAFCFNRLLYRNSTLYMTIDNQIIYEAGLPYMVYMPDVLNIAKKVLYEMRDAHIRLY